MPPKSAPLEAKVQWLCDIEEIKQLKARYAAACDAGYDAEAIAALFTEDGIWDGGGMGRAESRPGIRDFFKGVSSMVGFVVHGLSNPIIEVEGDRASGQWYLHQPMVLKETGACYWLCAQYRDTYRRTDDGWKIEELTIETRALSPYEDGFGKTLFAELPSA